MTSLCMSKLYNNAATEIRMAVSPILQDKFTVSCDVVIGDKMKYHNERIVGISEIESAKDDMLNELSSVFDASTLTPTVAVPQPKAGRKRSSKSSVTAEQSTEHNESEDIETSKGEVPCKAENDVTLPLDNNEHADLILTEEAESSETNVSTAVEPDANVKTSSSADEGSDDTDASDDTEGETVADMPLVSKPMPTTEADSLEAAMATLFTYAEDKDPKFNTAKLDQFCGKPVASLVQTVPAFARTILNWQKSGRKIVTPEVYDAIKIAYQKHTEARKTPRV